MCHVVWYMMWLLFLSYKQQGSSALGTMRGTAPTLTRGGDLRMSPDSTPKVMLCDNVVCIILLLLLLLFVSAHTLTFSHCHWLFLHFYLTFKHAKKFTYTMHTHAQVASVFVIRHFAGDVPYTGEFTCATLWYSYLISVSYLSHININIVVTYTIM